MPARNHRRRRSGRDQNHLVVFTSAVLTVTCMIISVGCGPKFAADPNPNRDANTSPAGVDAADANAAGVDAADAPSITLTAADWPTIEAALPDRGIVVVDFWSTACMPCMTEFPHLVELAADYPDVRCVAVNVDYDGRASKPAETYRDDVTAFLRRTRASAVENYLCETPIDDVLQSVDAYSIPAVRIYRDGDVAETFIDSDETAGFTYASHIVPAIEAMVQTGSSRTTETSP